MGGRIYYRCCGSFESTIILTHDRGVINYYSLVFHSYSESLVSVEVARQNLITIKERFAKLVNDVAAKLNTVELDFEAFHFFMVDLFPPGKCIPQSKNVIKIFEAVTQNGLWSYWHFSPVENIIKEYAPSDDEMKSWVDNYRKDLSGYKATTKIADAMEIYSSSIEEFEEADPDQRPLVTCDPTYLRCLSVKLKTRVTEKTLVYIDDLWLSLAEKFLLPSLSVLLDKIQAGCVEVTWLIPPHYVFQIVGNLQENATFLQSKGIMKVLLDGECVYDGGQEKKFRRVGIYHTVMLIVFLIIFQAYTHFRIRTYSTCSYMRGLVNCYIYILVCILYVKFCIIMYCRIIVHFTHFFLPFTKLKYISIMHVLHMQSVVDTVSKGGQNKMLALLTSGIDINLEVYILDHYLCSYTLSVDIIQQVHV